MGTRGHYSLSLSPSGEDLLITLSEKRQVWRLPITNDSTQKEMKWSVVAGTGARCLPGARDACGDGGLATKARLDFPKSTAQATDGTLFISDGRNVRVVSAEGIIDTLLGKRERSTGPPKPLACKSSFPARDVQLQWPTKVLLNPLDGSLHIVDDTVVLKLTKDLRLGVIAGRSPLCESVGRHGEESRAVIADADFDADGRLFLAEKRASPDKSSISVVDFYGAEARHFAGLERKSASACTCGNIANCTSTGGACENADEIFANEIALDIAAITVSADGSIYAGDNTNYQIVSINPAASPQLDPVSGEARVTDPVASEVYTFNRYGQHIATNDIGTGETLYSFAYSKNTVYGRLTEVRDALGNKITLQRDYADRVQAIENSLVEKHAVKLSDRGRLEVLKTDDRNFVRFTYDDESGLLTSAASSGGDFSVFEYDDFGRLETAALASGENFRFQSSFEECNGEKQSSAHEQAFSVTVQSNGLHAVKSVRVEPQSGKVSFLHLEREGHRLHEGEIVYSILLTLLGTDSCVRM